MASPRERDYRAPSRASDGRSRPRGGWHSAHPPVVHRPYFHDDVPAWRQHFHDAAPAWPQHRYHDYIYVDRSGWWPRWFPYWDQRWIAYWWHLYDYYGGDASPEYAAYARDAMLRQNAARWGLAVGAWMGADPQDGMIVRDHRGGGTIVRDHRGGGLTVRDHRDRSPVHVSPSPVHAPHSPVLTSPSPVHAPHVPVHVSPSPVHPPHPSHPQHPEHHDPYHRPRHEHPHFHYGDYVVVDRYWWPRWFPYWDPAWAQYWWQLFNYYGGASYPDYALYAVDATLRGLARRWGWL